MNVVLSVLADIPRPPAQPREGHRHPQVGGLHHRYNGWLPDERGCHVIGRAVARGARPPAITNALLPTISVAKQ